MTTPTIGAPDFQGYGQWRGSPLAQGAFTITSVTPLTVQGYVTNFASLALYCNLLNGVGVTVRVQYFSDSTLSAALATYQWTISTVGIALQVLLPNVGDYVQVTFLTGQAGNQPLRINVEPTNLQTARPAYSGTSNSVDAIAANIGAGATLSLQLPFVVEGDGQLFVQCAVGAVSFNIECDSLLESGALASNLARATAITGSGELTFLAPAATCQLAIKNNDAAAHNFSWHCQIIGR